MGNAQASSARGTHVVEHGSIEAGIMISEGHMRGRRKTQEDTAFVNIKNIEELPECSILGLFDGHGGPNVALYAARNFERVFREELRLEVMKKPVLLGSRDAVAEERDVDELANNMLEDKKKKYNADNDVKKLYETSLEDDIENTFRYYSESYTNKTEVEYYHILQYFYGIVDRKQDDDDCKEAFKEMLKWKDDNINYSVNNIDAIIQPEFIKNVFKNAFKAIDEEIKEKFFEWSVQHNCPTGCYKLRDKYEGALYDDEYNKIRFPDEPADEAGEVAVLDADDVNYEGVFPSSWLQGCTAEVVLFTPMYVITAHAGDSRTIHVNNNGVVKNSGHDHKPNLRVERERIEAAGGNVSRGRVKGMLAVSRGLGDFTLKSGTKSEDYTPEKQMVSSEPDVEILDKANIKFLATACDGVWDVLKNPNDVTATIKKKLDYLKGNNAFPTYLNKMSETVKHVCEVALRLKTDDNISLLLTYFDENDDDDDDDDEDRYLGKINISTWDPNIVMAWVKSFYERSASHVDVKSGADHDAVLSAITAINNAFEGKDINGDMLLSPELKKNIELKGEHAQLAEKILADELEIIKIGPKGWNLDWFEAWLEIGLVDDRGRPITPGKLVYIHFIKHMCNRGLRRAEGQTEVWSCESVEPYDKIGEILLAADDKEIKKKFDEFKTYVAKTIPKSLEQEKEMVEEIRAAARAKARETRQGVEDFTDKELLPLVEDPELRQKLVLYNEMDETLSLYQMAGYGAGIVPTFGNVSRFLQLLRKLQKGEYDWLKIKNKVYELKKEADERKLMTAEDARSGGKKSRKLRRRTTGGKKSRKLRKRTTLKGGKRKRRRTRRRR